MFDLFDKEDHRPNFRIQNGPWCGLTCGNLNWPEAWSVSTRYVVLFFLGVLLIPVVHLWNEYCFCISSLHLVNLQFILINDLLYRSHPAGSLQWNSCSDQEMTEFGLQWGLLSLVEDFESVTSECWLERGISCLVKLHVTCSCPKGLEFRVQRGCVQKLVEMLNMTHVRSPQSDNQETLNYLVLVMIHSAGFHHPILRAWSKIISRL